MPSQVQMLILQSLGLSDTQIEERITQLVKEQL